MRHIFTREECSRGGTITSHQPEHIERCRKGFEKTMETHPYFARKWLKRSLRSTTMDELTVEDLKRVFIRVQGTEGWHAESIDNVSNGQFDTWARGWIPIENNDGYWPQEDRAEFCNMLYQLGSLHLLKKE